MERVAQWLMFALVVWATTSTAARVPPDLTKLQRQVAEWRQHATRDQLDEAAESEAHLADCTDEAIAKAEPEKFEYGGMFAIDDDAYSYSFIDVGEERFCLFMIRPLHRPLSLAEAIDVQDAQVMLRGRPVKPKVYSSEETKVAEAHFAELLAAVRSGTHAPVDKKHPPSPLDQGDLADCSDFDSHDLPDPYGESQFIYNNYYDWVSVPREHGKRCIYLKAPFNRGLNAADASDFLMAPHLRLTQAAEDAPDLERTIKASLERFGSDAALPTDRLSSALIDCQDFDPSPQENDQNISRGGGTWMFDGIYGWNFYYFPKGTCLVVGNEQDARGLTAKEARAFLHAARVGVDDPRHAEAQRAHNCLQKVTQNDNANIPAYESGTVNGRRYHVFYAALDADLKLLDDAQHAFVASRKEAWRQSPLMTAHDVGSLFDTEIRFDNAGRTKQLEALHAWEASPGSLSPPDARKYWLLHVPSGRLLAFEDLFTDPNVVHDKIAVRYLHDAPQYVDYAMGSIAFLGDDAEQQAKDFRAHALSAAQRIATTEHFVGVAISADGERTPFFVGEFTLERLAEGALPGWHAELKDLAPYFKPEFRDVLDGIRCAPMPAVP